MRKAHRLVPTTALALTLLLGVAASPAAADAGSLSAEGMEVDVQDGVLSDGYVQRRIYIDYSQNPYDSRDFCAVIRSKDVDTGHQDWVNTPLSPYGTGDWQAWSPWFSPFYPAAVVFYRCNEWQGDSRNVPFELWRGVYYVEPLNSPNRFEAM
jgi:hypothetical protein